MTDIVERLRAKSNHPESDLSEAADEIERLRHDISRLMASLSGEVTESERLRVALAFYADVSDYHAPLTGGLGKLYFDCGETARAALEGKK